jgi:hypothetical protein
MTDPLPPSTTRIYFTPPPFLRALGCTGCGLGCAVVALVVFLLGGLFGVLLFG